MKKIAALLSLFLVTRMCHGAPKTIAKKDQKQGQQQSEQQIMPQEPPPKPTGPVGLGPIKIGMQMDAVTQLQETDGVYLAEPLSAYENKYYTPKPGIEKYATKIKIPNASKPLESVLTFSANQLTEIYLNFENSPYLYDKVKDQIAEKYNQGAIKDERKEEQCIYKNGANFKITTGTVATTWRQALPSGEAIETRLSEFKFDMCPSNLRYGSVGGTELKSLTIRKVEQATDSKKDGLF